MAGAGDLERGLMVRRSKTDVCGRAGGLARSKALTPERRKEISAKAVKKRWAGHTKKPKKLKANTSEK